ncbi:IS3 family transposase [Streptococcus salivarius]
MQLTNTTYPFEQAFKDYIDYYNKHSKGKLKGLSLVQ